MAGIGFELKRFLGKESYLGLISAYGFAGLICSGPWLLSILTILVLSVMSKFSNIPANTILVFQILIVYLIAFSLMLSGVFQHSYTRYIANQIYLKHFSDIIPSLNSVFLVLILSAASLGFLLIKTFLPSLSLPVQLLLLSSFIILSLTWICTSILSGMLAYKTIFFAFLSNFLIAMSLGWFLHFQGLEGLLLSYLSGQFFMLLVLVYTIYHAFPSNTIIHFKFFTLKDTNKMLILTGLLYNIGIWADKFIFWYSPQTGITIIDALKASYVYDIPIFFAYLAAIPGMAVFLLNLETTYTDAHEFYFKRITGNHTLAQINHAYFNLMVAARDAIYSAVKSQSIMFLFCVVISPFLLAKLQLSSMYLPLFIICLLSAGLNIILWAVLDIIFYLDRIKEALLLNVMFVFTNIVFTTASIHLGIFYYGFGLALSLFVTSLTGFLFINRIVLNLTYETYMVRN